MPHFAFQTVDVFTTTRVGGNPLAVFPDARGLTDVQMQALAREFNLSETTFVLPPDDPAHTARVRIFTPGGELPFAGHPNVGTGYLLAQAGLDRDGVLLFEELAGLVRVEVTRDAAGAVTSTRIAAPVPLSTSWTVPAAVIAACIGVTPDQILTDAHPPVCASVGTGFVIAKVTGDALTHAVPDTAAMRAAWAAHAAPGDRFNLHIYAEDGPRLRTRMFAPMLGVPEDPATGSANTALAALLLSLTGRDRLEYEAMQGVEMGRPSLLHLAAWRTADGWHASVGGACVDVLRGEAVV